MMDLFTSLILGAMGSKYIDEAIEKNRIKKEQKRLDSLFWQDAIRKKYDIHDECDDKCD